MKTALVLLLVFVAVLVAPAQNQMNLFGQIDSSGGTVSLIAHSFAGTDNDTIITEDLNTMHFKTLYLNLFAYDSATILIDYALSTNALDFTGWTLKDSLQHSTDGTYGFKGVDLTSTVLGASHIRFRFRPSALAFPLGTDSTTFSPTYTFKRW